MTLLETFESVNKKLPVDELRVLNKHIYDDLIGLYPINAIMSIGSLQIGVAVFCNQPCDIINEVDEYTALALQLLCNAGLDMNKLRLPKEEDAVN
jgi:hypothetical protein